MPSEVVVLCSFQLSGILLRLIQLHSCVLAHPQTVMSLFFKMKPSGFLLTYKYMDEIIPFPHPFSVSRCYHNNLAEFQVSHIQTNFCNHVLPPAGGNGH